jgi:hypothetical protein
MSTLDSRHVAFEACFNFRDLGGYETRDGRRVRWRTVYRSDTLHRLTVADERAFAELGLRTVIDLRSRTEVEDYGRLRVGDDGITWLGIPMLDDVRLRPRDPSEAAPALRPADPDAPTPEPGEGYARILDDFGGAVARAIKLLAREAALPAVFHCTSGKDRTGILAAVILDVLGVPDDTIAADYMLTAETWRRSLDWIEVNEPDFAAFLAELPPEVRAVTPDKILGFLAKVRAAHGSIPELLGRLGVTGAELDSLRARLIEDQPGRSS